MSARIGALAALLLAGACGGEGVDGELSVAERRLSLVPALDVSALPDEDLRGRVLIEEVVAHVADVRVRGEDSGLPAGGVPLVRSARTISSRLGGQGLVVPAEAASDDLAIHVRLARSPILSGASVVVRGRLYAQPMLKKLSARDEPDPDGEPAMTDPLKEPDPDGEPADPSKSPPPTKGPAPLGATGSGEMEEPDPDGEPAAPSMGGKGGTACEPDPDGEPAMGPCAGKALLRSSAYVVFELHGTDAVDLLVDARDAAAIEVVVGMPAEQWLTPAVLRYLQTELSRRLTSGVEEEIAGSVVVVPVSSSSSSSSRGASGYRLEVRERAVEGPDGE